MQSATVVFQMKQSPKYNISRNQLLVFFRWSTVSTIFSFGLNWTHQPVIGPNQDTAGHMVEFGCLETQTLKFCKDLEYRADMSKSKNIKKKTGKESSKAIRYL